MAVYGTAEHHFSPQIQGNGENRQMELERAYPLEKGTRCSHLALLLCEQHLVTAPTPCDINRKESKSQPAPPQVSGFLF